MILQLKNQYKSFGGWTRFYSHFSQSCQSEMRFSIFLPPHADGAKVPVLYWLSGLTCTEENFMVKAGAQRVASELGIAIVCPDTSPRGLGLPGDSESWDFGVGAGFYVNATQAPWASHYRMDEYVSEELPAILAETLPVDRSREAISGHSMGGHGALVLALRQSGRYRSVSAFSPICAPSLCPWGQKAFSRYLGEDRAAWAAYDAHQLVARSKARQPLFVDQGTDDTFLKTQLLPELLEKACREHDYPLKLRLQTGYDHSYYFIASFIEEHLQYHAQHLK